MIVKIRKTVSGFSFLNVCFHLSAENSFFFQTKYDNTASGKLLFLLFMHFVLITTDLYAIYEYRNNRIHLEKLMTTSNDRINSNASYIHRTISSSHPKKQKRCVHFFLYFHHRIRFIDLVNETGARENK
jgi:hypothetical protein